MIGMTKVKRVIVDKEKSPCHVGEFIVTQDEGSYLQTVTLGEMIGEEDKTILLKEWNGKIEACPI